jgi:hypothetical protein
MKTKPLTVCLIVLCIAVLISPKEPLPANLSLTSDPLLGVGHGAFIGSDGREVIPNAEFIQNAQKYYIDRLLENAAASGDKNLPPHVMIQRTQNLIYRLVKDIILANALFIDWLIEKIPLDPDNVAHLTSRNNALRWHYVLTIQREPILPTVNVWTKGIEPKIARELESEGITVTVLLATVSGGNDTYAQQCRDLGVPVPRAMFSSESGWVSRGVIFDNEFLDTKEQAELWTYTSTSPPGVCLALPRYPIEDINQPSVLGLICLGTQANKACFFDNPQGKKFTRNIEVDISQFLGGVDLGPNGQGTCTDCHAGENPFVVHPKQPAFERAKSLAEAVGLSLSPSGWYKPVGMPASWPQNPGPTVLLDKPSPLPSPGKCDSCHRAGAAGRFPEVSTQLGEYCRVVLRQAVGRGGTALHTMPPNPNPPPLGGDTGPYTAHINALLNACGEPPSTSTGVVVVVDLPDDKSHVSPPIVIDPLYQCATRVAVRGAELNAKLSLYINGALVNTLIARNPTEEQFNVPALVAGNVVTATQEFNGALSAPSAPVTVRDHTVDFPSGLPAPEIDPTLIYECAQTIAVRHVPGATITVYRNNSDPKSFRTTSKGWTAVDLGDLFVVADSFTAEAALCTDVSPRSAAASAVAEPATIPTPTFNPATVYAGQELVTVETLINGSLTFIDEASFGRIDEFTWPVSWKPDFDVATPLGRPLSAGDLLIAGQFLCSEGAETTAMLPPAERCDALSAPRIRVPLVGDNNVVVTMSVPGARIRVHDGSGDELGDGSGTVIILKRVLTGVDTITVVQQLGECTSRTGYRVSVHNVGSLIE